MESLILSFNAVAPIFILMMVGYLLKRAGIARKSDFDMINGLVFKLFLPLLLFYNLYTTTSIETFDASIVLFTIAGVCVVFVLGYIFVRLTVKDRLRQAPILQGFFRSNFAILGIPLINAIFGENITGLTYLMVAVVVSLFNVLAVLCFELLSVEKGKTSIKSVLCGIAKNPLIIGCVLGGLFFAFKIKLPFVLEKAVSDASKIATPLSIIAIGGSFTFTSIKNCVKEVSMMVFSRLVLIPFIAVVAAVALGFRGEALACILITFGGPIAISSFAMAQQMECDEDVAANGIVFSYLLCMLTLFCWIFILNILNLF